MSGVGDSEDESRKNKMKGLFKSTQMIAVYEPTDLTGKKREPTDLVSPRPCKKSMDGINSHQMADHKSKNTDDGDDKKKGEEFVDKNSRQAQLRKNWEDKKQAALIARAMGRRRKEQRRVV